MRRQKDKARKGKTMAGVEERDRFDILRERMVRQARMLRPEIGLMTREEKLKRVCDFIRIFEQSAKMSGLKLEILDIRDGKDDDEPMISFRYVRGGRAAADR